MNFRNDNKINIFLSFDCDEKYINGRASDFELFCEWESLLCLAREHREVEHYLEYLSSISLPPPSFPRTKIEGFERWRTISCDDAFDCDPLRDNSKNELLISAKTPPDRSVEKMIDIDRIVSENITKYNSVSELIIEVSKGLKEAETEYIYLNISGKSFDFIKPNPYLCEVIFNKIKSGEKYNYSEKLVFIIELVIMIHKELEELCLIIDGKDAVELSEVLLPYFNERSLFSGKVLVASAAADTLERIIGLSRQLYPGIKVYPFYCENEEPSNRLVSVYPRGAFYRIKK